MAWIIAIVVALVGITTLAYVRASAAAWTGTVGAGLLIVTVLGMLGPVSAPLLWLLYLAAAILVNHAPYRREYISDPLFASFKKRLPQVSPSEQEALQAGTVWWDGELFSGRPDWNKLLAYPKPALSEEERSFLDGPVEELCAMLDDWKMSHELYDLPPEAWRLIREKGFLGMIIPKRYGGLEFSALAHSEVVMKLSSRSNAAAVTVMVPSSLGPAELLWHYGTEEQKNYYLPRLAKGQEIPCFALTSPEAGSDAGAIPDVGIVCRGEFQGRQDVLGARVTWEKRYITLGPVATLLGLAFKLYDPDQLLGGEVNIGITLALIPTDTPGVNIGRRHFPLNGVFQNGPTSGKDVFIPMEWVIGGQDRIGHGWRMLMECLAAGRSISLPAQSAAAAKFASRVTGAYARIRTQFNLPIGRFEGVEEALARIGGHTYLMEATRILTAGALDLGERPAVLSAIAKYHLTERMRIVVNDAMDVHGGKAICLGPNNYLGGAYQLLPIAITVEGANILTRSLIIFGQGAIRCHPYVLQEIALAQDPDGGRAAESFDRLLCEHVSFALANGARALVLGLSSGRFVTVPGAPEVRRYYQQLNRFAAAFALLADVALITLGGSLKRKENLSARLGDVLSHLYLSSAALKRYEDEGRQRADLPLLAWALHDSFFRMQAALNGVLENFPNRSAAWVMRRLIFPKGRTLSGPSDLMGHGVSEILLSPSDARERLTAGIYLPDQSEDPVARLEHALKAVIAAEPINAKLRAAQDTQGLRGKDAADVASQGIERGVISMKEYEALQRARTLTRAVIMVDDFPPDFGRASTEWQPQAQAAAG
jgi:acyl-CoA dehydrogenase